MLSRALSVIEMSDLLTINDHESEERFSKNGVLNRIRE